MAQAVYGVFAAHGGADSLCGVPARDEPGSDGTVHGAGAEECYMFGHLRSLLSASFVSRGACRPHHRVCYLAYNPTPDPAAPRMYSGTKGLRFAARM